ncbi:RHOMBOID-like protein 9, chloroplastic [Nymphaea colorata]|nr:RHOMBOID-like protein 9, chloroplastic [Nymphaea colorata]
MLPSARSNVGIMPLCLNGASTNWGFSIKRSTRTSTSKNSNTTCHATNMYSNSKGDYIRSGVILQNADSMCTQMKLIQKETLFSFRKQIMFQGIFGPSSQSTQVRSARKTSVERDKHLTRSNPKDTSTRTQLNALESYLEKLDQADKQRGPDIVDGGETKLMEECGSADNYIGKLVSGSQENSKGNNDVAASILLSSSEQGEGKGYDSDRSASLEIDKSVLLSSDDIADAIEDAQPDSEGSHLGIVGILVAINVAVFLFEMASPVKGSESEYLSLPLLYGAKINWLILNGEWWRLVTPMFLHSGLFHVTLSCWALLTFGPQVSRRYGSLTFFLIYILGGICGNMSSFVHTPEATVGGTGPVFAIIGAWVIYQLQNKETALKENSESMFQKAAIVTALGFVLSSISLIDDWTHLGATCAGLLYGYLTCPVVQLGNTSLRDGRQEGTAIVKRWTDQCKSFLTFCAFVLILGSLFFLFQDQMHANVDGGAL